MIAILFDGLIIGLQFAIVGVGLTVVFGLAGVLNLAYGQTVVVAAAAIALADRHVPTMIAIGIGVIAAMAMMLAADATLFRVIYANDGERRVLFGLLLTLAGAFVIDGVLIWRYPLLTLNLPINAAAVELFGVRMRAGSLVAAALAAAVLLTGGAGLRWTLWGRRIRAVSQDETGAALSGINVVVVRRLVVAVSGALAAVVAVTGALSSSVNMSDGFSLTIMGLIVAVVGGLGSVTGALVAGLVLGVAYAGATWWFGAVHTMLAMLIVAVGVIVFRRDAVTADRQAGAS